MSHPELPPGIEIEPVYLVEVQFTPQAAERRPAVRHEHLVRIAELKRSGTLIEGGAYADGGLTSSILIVRAVDAEAAAAVVRADVYVRASVWAERRCAHSVASRCSPGPRHQRFASSVGRLAAMWTCQMSTYRRYHEGFAIRLRSRRLVLRE